MDAKKYMETNIGRLFDQMAMKYGSAVEDIRASSYFVGLRNMSQSRILLPYDGGLLEPRGAEGFGDIAVVSYRVWEKVKTRPYFKDGLVVRDDSFVPDGVKIVPDSVENPNAFTPEDIEKFFNYAPATAKRKLSKITSVFTLGLLLNESAKHGDKHYSLIKKRYEEVTSQR